MTKRTTNWNYVNFVFSFFKSNKRDNDDYDDLKQDNYSTNALT